MTTVIAKASFVTVENMFSAADLRLKSKRSSLEH